MIYVILTYLFSPIIYFFIAIRKKEIISKILVIQTAKIGDLICSTPIFREIKKKYPHSHLTVMANHITKELLKYNPHVNEIILIKGSDYKGLFGKLRLSNLIHKGQYDAAICLNPNVSFALALFWGLVPVRLSLMPNFSGVTFKLASAFYTHLEKHMSAQLVTETYTKILKVIGIKNVSISKEVYKSENADAKAQQILREINKPLIGLAVSSGNKLKELGADKIIRLIGLLLSEMDIYITLIGSSQDKNIANIILGSVNNKKDKIIDATGRLNLEELPSLIEKLSLFIGVDTGITYMADALSIPIIHLPGPVDISEQHPTGRDVKIIQCKLPCCPCTYVFKTENTCKRGAKECITSINLDEILEEAKKLVNKTVMTYD